MFGFGYCRYLSEAAPAGGFAGTGVENIAGGPPAGGRTTDAVAGGGDDHCAIDIGVGVVDEAVDHIGGCIDAGVAVVDGAADHIAGGTSFVGGADHICSISGIGGGTSSGLQTGSFVTGAGRI